MSSGPGSGVVWPLGNLPFICVGGGGREGAGSGPAFSGPSPWELWAGLRGSPSRPDPNGSSPPPLPPSIPVQTSGLCPGLPATPKARVTHLLFCHPLCKPISVLFFLFFVNIKKV